MNDTASSALLPHALRQDRMAEVGRFAAGRGNRTPTRGLVAQVLGRGWTGEMVERLRADPAPSAVEAARFTFVPGEAKVR